jgi:hypothetical protein
VKCYGKWWVINGKGQGRKESCPNLSSTNDFPGGTEENHEKFNGRPFLGKNVYSGPPEYEVAEIPSGRSSLT